MKRIKVFLLLIIFGYLSALLVNALDTFYGSNHKSSCSGDICVADVYSYQKYYEENSEWKEIDENFGDENCGDYDYCVDGNVHQFYLYGDSIMAEAISI